KILLRKRAIIESVNDELKNICQIQHTRHRSFFNWAVNLLSGLEPVSKPLKCGNSHESLTIIKPIRRSMTVKRGENSRFMKNSK
ncbi:transposase, partial [Leptospira borgpetersenii]|uniref:transposase n=1 Tax=Leptospira borgpetersenii TaxID=174 RepID=UPI001E312534